MNNEELKKKICKIIAPYVSSWGEDERIADALIAAGIGDVSELKNHRIIAEYSLIPEDGNSCVLPDIPLRITQIYSGEEVENILKERNELKVELRDKVDYIHEQDEVIKEYKHRAARAERALDLCETAYILSLNHRATEGISGQAIASDFGIHKFFMKQAEKELAEEEKDD